MQDSRDMARADDVRFLKRVKEEAALRAPSALNGNRAQRRREAAIARALHKPARIA